MSAPTGAAIEVAALSYAWRGTAGSGIAFAGFGVDRGESVFVRGASGSGKSTLLGLLAGVLVGPRGAVRVLGTDLACLGASARDRFRGRHIGYVFQQFNLVPYLSVIDNVLLPCRFSRDRRERACAGGRDAHGEALRLLEALDLGGGLAAREAVSLSVGQQQRVAAARALIGSPEVVLADEPTSALDADRQAAFLGLLRAQCAAAGTALVFASHDMRLADRFDRVVTVGGMP